MKTKYFIVALLCMGLLATGVTALAGKEKKSKKAHDPGITIMENKEKAKEPKGKKKGIDKKNCYDQCREQHSAGIKECTESGEKPLSKCITRVNKAKNECFNKCRGKE